jgi:hypothetical protein
LQSGLAERAGPDRSHDKKSLVMSTNPTRRFGALHPARWEALMQNAMDLWFRTSHRRLRRALRDGRRSRLRCGNSARQLHDLGLSPAPAPSRGNGFADAEAQLGIIR